MAWWRSRQPGDNMGSQSGLPVYEHGYTPLPDGDDLKKLLPTPTEPYIDPALKKDITLYGEAAQATYDTVDLRAWSRYRDQNRFDTSTMLHDTHLKDTSHFAELPGKGYAVFANGFMRASERGKIEKSLKKRGQVQEDHVWIGYVAYSEKRKDILVAWRGTQRPAEWIADATLDQIEYKPYPEPPPKTLSVFAKLRPLLAAISWASPLLLFLGVKSAPSKFPADLVSFVGDFNSQVRATASGYAAKAVAALWAAIPVVFRRFRHSLLAGGAATALGVLPLTPLAGLAYVIGRRFPSFQAGGAVTLLATFPLAFLTAIPLLDLINKRGRNWWVGYALAASLGSFWVSVRFPGTFYHAVLALGASVFLPLAITAGQAAWAGATVTGACVHEGFFELYSKKLVEAGKEKGSPRDVLHSAIKTLLEAHPDCKTISVSGHSLGAALAVLSAFDLVKSDANKRSGHYVPVTCYSFEGPRVGNMNFAAEFRELKKQGLSAIRIVNEPDVVTQVPKALFLQNVYYLLGATFNCYWLVCAPINWFEHVSYALRLPSAYEHVGVEVTMDSRQIDYIQQMTGHNPFDNFKQISTYHNLESALHVLSGFSETPKPYGAAFDRDFALINKTGDCLDPRCGISPAWLDTLRPNVKTADPGGALIQPYTMPVGNGQPSDEERQIGWGPGIPSKPLRKDYVL